MPLQYKRVLCPIEFDDSNFLDALHIAAEAVRGTDGTLFVLTAFPEVVHEPAGTKLFAEVNQAQKDYARSRMSEVERKELAGIKHELLVVLGDPADAIVKAAREVEADLIVMATHGRRGLLYLFLGSVVESVLRHAPCPVLAVRMEPTQRDPVVVDWMTHSPVTAAPEEPLSSIKEKFDAGQFRSIPIVSNRKLVGIVTDRDLRLLAGKLADTQARDVMATAPPSVTPDTSLHKAARLLKDHKLDSLPVLEKDNLVGIITTTDVLGALND
jgi:nucleotide-binding universal stress UspA family protein/predicted transcriptional regulator